MSSREWPAYVARVHVAHAGSDLRDSTPFHAEDDAGAREVGQQLGAALAGRYHGGCVRVQVLELVIGHWDGACFSTSADRMVFDSEEESDV